MSRSAEEAGAFVRKLQSLLRGIGSGDGDMEKVAVTLDHALVVKLTLCRGISESTSTYLSIDLEHLSIRDVR